MLPTRVGSLWLGDRWAPEMMLVLVPAGRALVRVPLRAGWRAALPGRRLAPLCSSSSSSSSSSGSGKGEEGGGEGFARRVGADAFAEGDVVLRALSENNEVSCLVVDGRELVSDGVRRQGTSPVASVALGRALLGTCLLGAFRGEDETVTVRFEGDGPLEGLTCVADHRGFVRGLVGNRYAAVSPTGDGFMDVGAAVGGGELRVVRQHPLWKEPYVGSVAIQSGRVAEDFAHYLGVSEQQQCAMGLGVTLDAEGGVAAAGGYLVQVLPYAAEESLARLEANLAALPPPAQLFHADQGRRWSAAEVCDALLGGIGHEDGGGVKPSEVCFSLRPRYGPCDLDNLKERMGRAVVSLGKADAHQLAREQGAVQVSCEFCQETVAFDADDLDRLFDEEEPR